MTAIRLASPRPLHVVHISLSLSELGGEGGNLGIPDTRPFSRGVAPPKIAARRRDQARPSAVG